MKNKLIICFIAYLIFELIMLEEFGVNRFVSISLGAFFITMVWFVIVGAICISILYIREVKQDKLEKTKGKQVSYDKRPIIDQLNEAFGGKK